MLNYELIREEYAFLGDNIHVNSCQIGLPPLRTQRASQMFLSDFAATAAEGRSLHLDDAKARVGGLLARLIGGSPQGIAFTKNTTEGIAILATGYPLGPGDNVVTCDLENQSNLYPWFMAAQKRGFEIRVAKTTQGRVTIDDIASLMDGGTRIVALSAVQAGTGYYADLPALACTCHKWGAILAVDAIQAVGHVRIAVEEMGIDYLACGGYKSMLAGFGVGFLWCRPELIERIIPVYAGPQSAEYFPSPPDVTPGPEIFQLKKDAGRFESGTHNVYGVAMLESGAGLLLELGTGAIEEHVLGLERQLRQELAASPIKILTPESPLRQGGIVVGYYPPIHEEQVSCTLAKHKIRLTHRAGYIRLAVSFYNTVEQMAVIARALSNPWIA